MTLPASVILDSSVLFRMFPAHHWSRGSQNQSVVNSFVDA